MFVILIHGAKMSGSAWRAFLPSVHAHHQNVDGLPITAPSRHVQTCPAETPNAVRASLRINRFTARAMGPTGSGAEASIAALAAPQSEMAAWQIAGATMAPSLLYWMTSISHPAPLERPLVRG